VPVSSNIFNNCTEVWFPLNRSFVLKANGKSIGIGVRGGVAQPLPRLENYQGKLWHVLRESVGCSIILNHKKIQYSEKFQGNSCFSRKAQIAKKS